MVCLIREHGVPLLCGDCGGHRARSWSTRRDVSSPDHCDLSLVGCYPSTRAPIRRTSSGICISITLSISTSAGLRRPQCALMMAGTSLAVHVGFGLGRVVVGVGPSGLCGGTLLPLMRTVGVARVR
jgi:hypothetical protein